MKRLLVLGSLIFLIVALVLTGCVGKKANNPPIVEVAYFTTSSSITEGGSVSLYYKVSDPDGDDVTVYVNWGDGTVPYLKKEGTVSHEYSSADSYEVKIYAVDTKGAKSEEVVVGTVEVSPKPKKPLAITNFDLDEGPFLAGDTVHATLTVEYGSLTKQETTKDATVTIYWSTEAEGFGYHSVTFPAKVPGTIGVSFNTTKDLNLPNETKDYYVWVEVVDSEGASDTTRDYPNFVDYKRTVYENHVPGITLTATPSQGNVDDKIQVVVTVDYKGDNAVRDDINNVEIDFGASNTYAYSGSWDPTLTNKSKAWEFYYRHIGAITIVATVTDDVGNVATATKVVTIKNRPPTISIVVTNTPIHRGDNLGFDLVVSDPDVGKADNEKNVEYSYTVKVDDTPCETGSATLNVSNKTDSRSFEVKKLGSYVITAEVTDSFDESATDEVVVGEVVNYPVENIEIATEDVYYEDETFVATVTVEDTDVTNGYDTLEGTFTLVTEDKKVEGNIEFHGTVGTIIVDKSNLDPVMYDLYVKVWDVVKDTSEPAGGSADANIRVEVKSRLYAKGSWSVAWDDEEDGVTRESSESTIYLRGNDETSGSPAPGVQDNSSLWNVDKDATLTVQVDVTNVREPYGVKIEWSINGGPYSDLMDYSEPFEFPVGANNGPWGSAHVGDKAHIKVWVISTTGEKDEVLLDEFDIEFVEGHDPWKDVELGESPTTTVLNPGVNGTYDEELAINGNFFEIGDESTLTEYYYKVEKYFKGATSLVCEDTLTEATSLFQMWNVFTLEASECWATFTVTLAATDIYGNDNEDIFVFSLKDMTNPVITALEIREGANNYTGSTLDAMNNYPVDTTTPVYYSNNSQVSILASVYDRHWWYATLTVLESDTGYGVADELFYWGTGPYGFKDDPNANGKVSPILSDGEYYVDVVATDVCNNSASTRVLLVIDTQVPTLTIDLEGTPCAGELYATFTANDAYWIVATDITYSYNGPYSTLAMTTGAETSPNATNGGYLQTFTATRSLAWSQIEATLTITFGATDVAGNGAVTSVATFLDNMAPRIEALSDIQFDPDSTVITNTALTIATMTDYGTIVDAAVTYSGSVTISSVSADTGVNPTGYATVLGIELAAGTYTSNVPVATITVTATDACGHTATDVVAITVDNLVWSAANDYFYAFSIEDTSSGSDMLYITLKNPGMTPDSTFATMTDDFSGIEVQIYQAGVYIPRGYGAGATVKVSGSDYVTYEIPLDAAEDNIVAGNKYRVVIPANIFKWCFPSDDINFPNSSHVEDNVEAVQTAPGM